MRFLSRWFLRRQAYRAARAQDWHEVKRIAIQLDDAQLRQIAAINIILDLMKREDFHG